MVNSGSYYMDAGGYVRRHQGRRDNDDFIPSECCNCVIRFVHMKKKDCILGDCLEDGKMCDLIVCTGCGEEVYL